ncbi:bile acid:sodium symporter family protein [Akkermansiaceae bacterium]|nr:bile acid:sodium symporter family protein [Akkermansiaceae bacterium]
MTLTFADFREVLTTPRWVVLGIIAQFLIMPLIGWGVASIFSLPAQFKLGIILVSCCPGGTASNVVTYLARGNLALSVMMTMCSTLLAIGLTPLLTKTYASAILEVDAWSMVVSMVMIVLLPIIIGLVLNSLAGERLGAIKKGAPLISVCLRFTTRSRRTFSLQLKTSYSTKTTEQLSVFLTSLRNSKARELRSSLKILAGANNPSKNASSTPY